VCGAAPMTMYVTKVWGVDDVAGPLVFSQEGRRDSASRTLKDGDLVILVGTMGKETEEGDRNRVLGIMEPSTIPVSTLDYPLPWLYQSGSIHADGSPRWPYALINKQAWHFAPGLFLADVAPRDYNAFGLTAATGIVPLSEEEAARVLAHPYYGIDLLQSGNPSVPSPFHDGPRGKGAPTPTEGVRRGVMHMRNAPADVYWFHLLRDDRVVGHKIGWAFDWRRRLRLFNSVSLPGLRGIAYQKHEAYPCPTARHAFWVERTILRELDQCRLPANQEVLRNITTDDLQPIWARHLNTMMKRPVGT